MADVTPPGEAEQVLRVLEEIIGVVSHDLRNPLGTILMGASTLLHGADPNDPKLARIRGVADRMQRQAERMARLIGDLVDFSAILGKRFTIAAKPSDPARVLEAAAVALAPLCADRGIELGTSLDGAGAAELPSIACDGERVVQLALVLGAAGLKVAPRGSTISLRFEPEAGGARFSVVLPLPAITDAQLPRLFDRGWWIATPGYTSAAFAFTLAAGIAEAHGAQVRADRVGDVGAGMIAISMAFKPATAAA